MSTYENLRQRYCKARLELQEAEENQSLVEQRHGGGSGNFSFGKPIQFLDVEHPEVQQAWERTKRARESVSELQRQLREWMP